MHTGTKHSHHQASNLKGDLESPLFLLAQSLDVAREQLDFLVNVIRHPIVVFSENSCLSIVDRGTKFTESNQNESLEQLI